MKLSLSFVASGAIVGLADLVPGVSGGTIALLLGIYPRLLTALAQLQSALLLLCRFKIKQSFTTIDFTFFIPFGAGALASLIIFSAIIKWLLANSEDFILIFFLGMILSTIWTLYSQYLGKPLGKEQRRWLNILAIALGILASLALQQLPEITSQPNLAVFFISGAFAICAMLLPGISGSLLLILIGMYQPILTAVVERNFIELGSFSLGAITGLLLCSRLLLYVYQNYQQITMLLLIGLIAGSLPALLPQQDPQTNIFIGQQILYFSVLVALLILGILSGWWLSRTKCKF